MNETDAKRLTELQQPGRYMTTSESKEHAILMEQTVTGLKSKTQPKPVKTTEKETK
jgi:hypothetical protein